MYLKKNEVTNFSDIKDDMSQIFEHEFKKSVYKNEIIKRKHEGYFTDNDVDISRMLLDYRFVTAQQLHEAVGEDISFKDFDRRLDQLVKFRIINRFAMSYDKGIKNIPDDAYVVYCLDVGGHHLLTHFSEGEELLDWFYMVNIVTSELVARDLMIADIGRQFLRNKPEGMQYFRPKPELRVGRKTMIPAFEFMIELNGRQNYFVGEVMRSGDPLTLFKDKANKWNQLLTTNSWRKYYGGSDAVRPPTMLVLTSDDETAFHASKILDETGEIADFRVTTEARSKNPLYEKGSFLRYNKKNKSLGTVALVYLQPAD